MTWGAWFALHLFSFLYLTCRYSGDAVSNECAKFVVGPAVYAIAVAQFQHTAFVLSTCFLQLYDCMIV